MVTTRRTLPSRSEAHRRLYLNFVRCFLCIVHLWDVQHRPLVVFQMCVMYVLTCFVQTRDSASRRHSENTYSQNSAQRVSTSTTRSFSSPAKREQCREQPEQLRKVCVRPASRHMCTRPGFFRDSLQSGTRTGRSPTHCCCHARNRHASRGCCASTASVCGPGRHWQRAQNLPRPPLALLLDAQHTRSDGVLTVSHLSLPGLCENSVEKWTP
jgi:hypothetical protein